MSSNKVLSNTDDKNAWSNVHMLYDTGADLWGAPCPGSNIFTCKIFQSPIFALMPILQFIYKSNYVYCVVVCIGVCNC